MRRVIATPSRIEAAIARVISQSWIDAFDLGSGLLAATTVEGEAEGAGVFETEGDGVGWLADFDGCGVETAFVVARCEGAGLLEDDEVFTAPEFELTISDDSSTASNARAGTLLS